ncbi:3-oxoacyl-[acyl-carrier-protein] synthase III C-terminal domain-containing protein [Serratia sp. NPDC078593]|uniref:3-oxoacyl-[acyl-carrier-protein] synthase III C-terminal domain-containing protein n=1 Tax=unclassified Serratia (in: enterobacteria) TaxID=2647522 RepID=UPI0037D57481
MGDEQQGQTFQYKLAGISTLVGRVVPMDEWAESFKIPHRKKPGQYLTGEDIQKIIGPVESKSWDPDLFGDFNHVVNVAKEAMLSAGLTPNDVDVVMVASSTPYEVQLDYDSFRLLRALGIPDHIPPLQLAAGCAGMARALSLAARLKAKNILVVTYEVSSLYMVSPIYRYNKTHPLRDSLWASPALFSDGIAAVVLRHHEEAEGYSLYSRDSLSFGDEAGFDDPLIHYPGGGALNPPGIDNNEELACYAMAGDQTKRYYAKGMKLNHLGLAQYNRHYHQEVARIYTHQASPNMVENYIEQYCQENDVDRAKFSTNARRYGNLVIPSTLKLIHDDLQQNRLHSGDRIAVLVVGAGPERGAFTIDVE